MVAITYGFKNFAFEENAVLFCFDTINRISGKLMCSFGKKRGHIFFQVNWNLLFVVLSTE